MNLFTMQAELPTWSVNKFDHAVTHAMKALGQIAAMVDDADHVRDRTLRALVATDPRLRATRDDDNFKASPEEVAKFAADLVVCALKLAQTCPSGSFDLEKAVVERVREKNPPGTFPSAGTRTTSR